MLENAINNIKYYATGKSVAISVSGGSDSMCLLSLFSIYKPLLKDIVVLTFDHQIREYSQFETEFVKKYCEIHNIDCRVYKCDIPNITLQSGNSIEVEARLWRQKIYHDVLQQVDMIALGHHRDDQIETVLFRIFRGTGIKGLSGMNIFSTQKLFRPMLNTTKLEINEYIKNNNLVHVVDKSNIDNKYDRNFLRNQILPILKSRWDTSNIANLAESAQSIQKYLDYNIDKTKIIRQDGSVLIYIECLYQPLYSEYIAHALETFEIKRKRQFVLDIMELTNCQTGKYKYLKDGVIAIREYQFIRLYKESNVNNNISVPYVGISQYQLGAIHFELTNSSIIDIKSDLVFDACKIPSSAVFRYKRQGDIFKQFGGYTKPLKKYLIDKKISKVKRNELLLLADNNNILLIVGLAIADSIKCDTNTKNFVKIQCIKK
ncbi:MAG: tRNA lysidine(34) synthetase TilS [Firmicutes bacterium]|nr:tRNA lysidine(34) synthetase TilS [Bacillota bacterium]MCL1953432.1 tRNA lysidine(34) synthetase TilS [Bacillota bacterium]